MKEGNSATPETPCAEPEARTRLTEVLHIFALVGFAVAQPLFDRLSRNLVFLKDQGVRPASLVTLVLILSVFVPAVIVMLEIAVGVVHRGTRSSLESGENRVEVFVVSSANGELTVEPTRIR